MFRSGEIRWFFPGTEPDGEARLIGSGPLAREQTERIDRYLVLPDCATVGVKFRDGNFEIKAQITPPERVAYGHGVAGFRGTWVKWSRAAADLLDLGGRASADETWVFLRKRRTVRLLSLESAEPGEADRQAELLAGAGRQRDGGLEDHRALRARPLILTAAGSYGERS